MRENLNICLFILNLKGKNSTQKEQQLRPIFQSPDVKSNKMTDVVVLFFQIYLLT